MNLKENAKIDKIVDFAKKGKLIVVVGAGVSVGLTDGRLPGWCGLIKGGFQYALTKGCITLPQFENWSAQLASSDVDELIGAAEFFGRKLGAPDGPLYKAWLRDVFADAAPVVSELAAAMKIFADLSIPICTLNYDSLLSQVTGLPRVTLKESNKVQDWMRRDVPSILHLHGAWDDPDSCILGVRDYAETQLDQVRQLLQRAMSTYSNLLFVGCGDTFADPNFSALITWLKVHYKATVPNHYALVIDSDVSVKHMDTSWAGFVDPVGYGDKHSKLPDFIIKNFSSIDRKQLSKRESKSETDFDQVINYYKSFVIRDCGQMTIEGVSADMETGQRKFDLERLFVPLKVSPCPPEFSATDPDRDGKLEKWESEKQSISFGRLLSKKKRVALLALPGGGKSLLLKRLAVAYSDINRLQASGDNLPKLGLMPLLIRCREWREYINLPVPTLLKRMPEITGQDGLKDFYAALVPLLKKGRVLLMIDGLDEIHNDADRSVFVENVEKFIEEYPDIRVIVTSREAGFDLVAPTIARFSERWRIDPLEDVAIESLCMHWHRLMAGDTPSAISEGDSVASAIIGNSSLRRLAENPLLLTMLLVVKHGAGGLPPDRVGLYSRAVDVLLDTWNIKGHESLNPKEAVPQLAYVAFEMMRQGKQTATERELLALLVEAREKHPNINRYAKDGPYEFLKRVELRSSLLLEAGHQVEFGRAVPFYQFRHLTFQEYLTAVAAVNGHYRDYVLGDTVLSPLEGYLVSGEWKEVVPMAAVLSGKHAEPLIRKLVEIGERELNQSAGAGDEKTSSASFSLAYSSAVVRIFQCLVEEAEVSTETLAASLRLIFKLSKEFHSSMNMISSWEKLCRGPFGPDLVREAKQVFESERVDPVMWNIIGCASAHAYQGASGYWLTSQGWGELRALLLSDGRDSQIQGLLTVMGLLWNERTGLDIDFLKGFDVELVDNFLDDPDPCFWVISSWIAAYAARRTKFDVDGLPVKLDFYLARWLEGGGSDVVAQAAYSLYVFATVDRDDWTPNLSPDQVEKIEILLKADLDNNDVDHIYEVCAALLVAFYAKGAIDEGVIISAVRNFDVSRPRFYRDLVAPVVDRISADLNILKKRARRKSEAT